MQRHLGLCAQKCGVRLRRMTEGNNEDEEMACCTYGEVCVVFGKRR